MQNLSTGHLPYGEVRRLNDSLLYIRENSDLEWVN